MNSRVLVSFAPDLSLISFALPPEGARSPDLSPEPGRVPTRAGGGGGGGGGGAETQATPATGQWKADSSCCLWLWPLLALFVSKLQQERSGLKDGETAKESVGS